MLIERRTIRDGVVVGLIGYAAVAVFYSAFDLLASRGTLYTVNLLGKTLFRGLRDPGVLAFPLEIDTTAVFLYNALHLAVALAIGLVVMALVASAEKHRSRRAIVRVVIAAGLIVTVAIVGILTKPIRPLLPMWSVLAANVLAAALAGAYLLKQRPGLWHRLALVGD